MADLRRISVLACVFVVFVRLAIGWQFLYEGLWKRNTLEGPTPWTAAGYLKNAQGPFRDRYREMAGDPDELDWLDYNKVSARWDNWHKNFLNAHTDLDDEQKKKLDLLLNGPESFQVPLVELPEKVKISESLAKAVNYDADKKRLVVDAKMHLTPAERDQLLRMAPATNNINKDFRKAVANVFKASSQLSFKERLAASLKGDPARAGEVVKDAKGNPLETRTGEIELYKNRLAEYEADLAKAGVAFQHQHLKKQWGEIQQMRSQLVGPVKALDADLQDKARRLLVNDGQLMTAAAAPALPAKVDQINHMTIWALIILGGLLMCGFLTRAAAIGAAVLLLSFYLAMPPWPGVVEFQELPGPEHSLIVDKNLIEVLALLAIAAMPTGSWFGVDAVFRRVFSPSKERASVSTASPSRTAVPAR